MKRQLATLQTALQRRYKVWLILDYDFNEISRHWTRGAALCASVKTERSWRIARLELIGSTPLVRVPLQSLR